MKPARQTPCSCGSGKPYAQCCGHGALHAFQNSAQLQPEDAAAHYDLGVAQKSAGRLDEAAASYRRAISLKPDYFEAHGNLSDVLQALGLHDEALISRRRALQIKHDLAEAHNNQGVVLMGQQQFDGAEEQFRRALQFKPDFARAHNNLGIALLERGQFQAAADSFRSALQLNPDSANAHSNLGNALRELGLPDQAVTSYRRALQIDPKLVDAHVNLGNALKDTGAYDEALTSYRRALALKPDYLLARTNLLFTLNYDAHSPESCLEEARNYGRIVADQAARFSEWQCAAQPERLRVGLVSGDLYGHPVGFFLESLLAHLDPSRIELIAYPTRHQQDELTARIRRYFSAWKPLPGLNDEAAARLIHADGVQVLIDLSGHTAHNRLPVFAWKPAPVQASWLGYFATTGVAEMDYLLADAVGVPEAQRAQFTESVWYLPDTRLCFTAPAAELAVTPLPALSKGRLTFGCFQNLTKVNEEVLAAWRDIFSALPDARLRMQTYQLDAPAQKEQLLQRLQRHGIDPARVATHGSARREAYLAAHAEVDMILDTFPYPGGTTTCEALWMGVPTLTLAGGSLLARQGASLLGAAGLAQWVANSKEEYVAKAIALASDRPGLARLRAGLRAQVLASPLFDAPRFARNFEEALWGMWQAWNAKQQKG